MSEVLVVADHSEGAVAKPALELLTLARRIGEPVAVVFGDVDLSATLAEYGATKVLVVDDPAVSEFLVAPRAEALQQIAADRSPVAVLISSGPEGNEIAGRLAVKLGSGIVTDAVDVRDDRSAVKSVFARPVKAQPLSLRRAASAPDTPTPTTFPPTACSTPRAPPRSSPVARPSSPSPDSPRQKRPRSIPRPPSTSIPICPRS